MIGQPHVLTITDVQRGIQAVASSLGTDVTTLVSTNNLSPPYITANPADKYGPALSSTTTSTFLPQGTQSVSLANQPQSTNMLYIAVAGPSGIVAQAVPIRSYDGTTFQLGIPLFYDFPSGTQVQTFGALAIGNINVLVPGDFIYTPITGTANFNLNTQSQLVDAFGADLAWPLRADPSTGDYATVTGQDCAQQRFATVLQTDLDSVPLHKDFGAQLRMRAGSSSPNTPWAAYVRAALMQLPEVTDVQNISAVQNGTSLPITADVYVVGSNGAIPLNTTVSLA